MSETIRIPREVLYAQVWETPLSHLASKYGISDVGLRKVLDRFEIPRPPAGYWAMKPERQIKAKRNLKPPSISHLEEVWFTSRIPDGPKIEVDSDHPQIERAEGFNFDPGTKPRTNRFTAILKSLKRQKPDKYGAVKATGIRITPTALNAAKRLCSFMDQLVRHQGWSIREQEHGLEIHADDEVFRLEINERIRRSDNPHYKDWQQRWDPDPKTHEKWLFHCTDEMEILIDGKKFIEKREPLIEQHLEIVKFVLTRAEHKREDAERRRVEAEKRLQGRRQHADEKRRSKEVEALSSLLLHKAEQESRWMLVQQYLNRLAERQDTASMQLHAEFTTVVDHLEPSAPEESLDEIAGVRKNLLEEMETELNRYSWSPTWR